MDRQINRGIIEQMPHFRLDCRMTVVPSKKCVLIVGAGDAVD